MDDALRPHTWAARVRRVVPTPLLLLVALATVLGAGIMSASAVHGSETRVRAIPTATASAVGQQSSERAGHAGCLRPSQPGFVSGSCVATELGDGPGRTFTHFTDEGGAVGISGTKPLAVGDSVGVDQLSFAKGENPFLASEPGRVFVTDLGPGATPRQLEGIGVFGAKQQYAIEFSEADAFASGARVVGEVPSRGIYSIPGGCTINGACTVTRVR